MSVENNGKTTEKKPGGVTGKGFMPGKSGNPAGRPKRRLVDEVLTELLEEKNSARAEELAKAQLDRACAGDTAAAKFVAERTQGKPLQKLQHSGPDGEAVCLQVVFVDPQGKETGSLP